MKLRKSQRIMSLFLSLLMLLSTFAGSGFTVRAAAEDADEPAIVEEVNNDTTTNDDTTADEETPAVDEVTDNGDEAPEIGDASAAGEEDPEIGDPDAYTDDIQFIFLNPTASAADTTGEYSHVKILDGETRDAATGFYGFTAADELPTTLVLSEETKGDIISFGATADEATPETAAKKWDATQPYVFTIKTATGYVFNTYAKTAAEKGELAKRLVRIWAAKDISNSTKAQTVEGGTVAAWETGYSVEIADDSKSATVTINPIYLKSMRDKAITENWDAPGIVVAPYITLNQRNEDALDKNIRKALNVANENDQSVFGNDVDESLISWGWGAQPDSYVVSIDSKSYDAKINETAKVAIYDEDMVEWDMSNKFELPHKPVTGVKVWRTDEGESKAVSTSGTYFTFTYDATNDQCLFKITKAGVNWGYGHGLTVKFLSDAYGIYQTNEDAAPLAFYKNTKNNGKNMTGIAKSLGKGGANALESGIIATYEASETRDLGSIDVSFGSEDATPVRFISGNVGAEETTESDKGESVYIPTSYISADMYVTANTREILAWTDSEHYVLDYKNASQDEEELAYQAGGTYETIRPYTGKDFTFPVYGVGTYEVTKVSYQKEGSTDKVELTRAEDGTYTIPGEVIDGPIILDIQTKDSTTAFLNVHMYVTDGVKGLNPVGYVNEKNDLGVKVTDFVAKDVNFGTDMVGTPVNDYSGAAVAIINSDTEEQPYFYFTVKAKNATRVVKQVAYRVTNGAVEFTTVEPVTAGGSLYRIANPGRDVEILVTMNKTVKVEMPKNEKVKLTINGKTYTSGKTTYVEYGQALGFSVETTNPAAIKISSDSDAVSYNPNMADPMDTRMTATKRSEGSYQIPADAVKADVDNNKVLNIYVQTIETVVDEDANGWAVRFGTTSTPDNNWAYDNEGKLAKGTAQAANKTDTDKGGVLRVNQNTSVTLTPAFHMMSKAEGTNETIDIDGQKTSYSIKSQSETVIKAARENDDLSSTKVVVDAKKEGIDSLSFTVVQASEDDNKDENLLCVTGDQEIDVTPHFIITMKEHRKKYLDKTVDTYVAGVINGATLRNTADAAASGYDSTNKGVTDLIKGYDALSTEAKAKVITWPAANSSQVHVTPITVDAAAVSTEIYADGEESVPFELNVKITDTDERVYTAENSLSLWPVEYRNFIVVPELNITGGTVEGGRYFGAEVAEKMGALDNTTAPDVINYMGINDLNKATLTLHVYEGNKEEANATTYAMLDTEAKIEAAEALSGDAQSWARAVESGVEFSVYDSKSDGVSVSGGAGGVFTLTADSNNTATEGYLDIDVFIGHINVNSVVRFNVCNDTELAKINIFTDDEGMATASGKKVDLKLKDSYLKMWNSVNDSAEEFTIDGADEDGYQFKLINGSQLTLPGENDFTDASYVDKKRMLVGWLVEVGPDGWQTKQLAPDTAAANPSADGDEKIVDQDETVETFQGGKYAFYAPESTISFINKNQKDQTYNIVLGIRPVWESRYKLLATAKGENPGVYVDTGATQEIKIWSEEDNKEISATVPRDSIQLSDKTNDVSVNGEMSIAVVALKATHSVTAVDADGVATVRYNRSYPAATGEGSVTWYSYDVKNMAGDANKVAYDRIQMGADVLTSDEQRKLALAKVLDSEALAAGKLKGTEYAVTEGIGAYLYAAYTDPDGNVYWLDNGDADKTKMPLTVSVKKVDQDVSVSISGMGNQDAIKNGIEVGETVQVTTGGISVMDGAAIAEDDDTITGKYSWNIKDENGKDSDILVIEEDPENKGTNKGALLPVITGVKEGTASVSLTYTSANGISVESKPISITVKAAEYSVSVTDKDGDPVESVSVKATKTNNTVAGTFYVSVKDKNGDATPAGTLSFESSESSIVDATLIKQGAADGVRPVNVTTDATHDTALGSTKVTITYTSTAGKKYKTTTTLETYFEIKLGGKNAAGPALDVASDTTTFDTTVKSDLNNTTEVKTRVVNASGTVLSDDEGVYILKVFEKDLTEKNGKGYIVSLDGLSMSYAGKNSSAISFAGWSKTEAVNADEVIDQVKVNDAKGSDEAEYPGNVKLYGNFAYVGASSVSVKDEEIILDAAGLTTPVNNEYKADAEDLVVRISPKQSNDVVIIRTDADGFFGYTEGKYTRSNDGTITVSSIKTVSTATKITLDKAAEKLDMDDNATTQDYAIGIVALGKDDNGTPLAGKATLTISTKSSNQTATVTLIVAGLYSDGTKLHYMTRSGEDLKDSSVTIVDKTYYFDENGDQITDGLAKNSNGDTVILQEGKAKTGRVPYNNKLYYADENGVVMTGLFTKNGKTYYGYPEEKNLAADEFVEIEGKLRYFNDGGEMIVGDGVAFTSIISQKTSPRMGTFEYLIDAEGVITTAALIDFGTEGKKVYINYLGQRVIAAMATDGKYTDPDTSITYVIDEDGYATLDKIFYFNGYDVKEDWTWNNGDPTITIVMKYVADDGTEANEELVLHGVTTDGDDVTYKTYKATTTAKFVRKGATEKEVVELTKKFDINGKSGVYTVKSYEIKWADAIAEGSTLPNVTAMVIYTVTEEDGTTTEETQNPVALVAQNTEKSTDSVKVFTASITVVAGSNGEGGDTITAEASYTVDGKLITHEDHVWGKPVFDWTGTTSQSGVAKAVFTCTADENAPHSVELTATVTEKSRKEASGKDKSKVVYTATVTGPDGKEYSENATITYTVDDDGKVIDEQPVQPGKGGDGIAVEFVDEDVDTNDSGYPVYVYTGSAIKPAVRVMDYDRDVELALSTDYTLKYSDNKKAGTATITVNGKGNYTGKTVTANFEIITAASKAEKDSKTLKGQVKSIAKISQSFTYTGAAQYPDSIDVTLKDKSVLKMVHDGEGVYSVDGESENYVLVSVVNNVNKGSATVAVTGDDGKTKKKTFKIAAAALPTGDDVYEAAEATYAVKGAAPASITGEFGDTTIVLGQDFTAKYSSNKAVGTGTATLKGKGNFTGTATVSFTINPLELDDDAVAVNAVPGKKVTAALVTVADGNGVKVPAKNLTVICDNSAKLAAGSEITVTIKGDGTNITGEVEKSIKVAANKKAKAAVAKGFTVPYTGEPVTLDEEQQKNITVTIGKATLDPEKYEVVGYLNNTKKGTMTVIIQGTDEETFTGVVTAKVKIVAKTMVKGD